MQRALVEPDPSKFKASKKIDFEVREISVTDLGRGFFETLSNLAPVGRISEEPENAKKVLHEITSNPFHKIFVAVKNDGEIIGSNTVLIEQKFIRNGGRLAHNQDLATKKGYEGMGIAKALMDRSFGFARQMKCYKVISECAEENVPFYEKFGFKKYQISISNRVAMQQAVVEPDPSKFKASKKIDFEVREISVTDLGRGFFETLSNLTPVGRISEEPENAKKVLHEITSNPFHKIFVAVKNDGEIIGQQAVLIEPKFIHNGERVAHVQDLSTKKGYEGMGIGTAVVGRVFRFARQMKCYKVISECTEETVPFHRKCGYTKYQISMRYDRYFKDALQNVYEV
jgi:glucosamine-phosphate N-acetyltransferase